MLTYNTYEIGDSILSKNVYTIKLNGAGQTHVRTLMPVQVMYTSIVVRQTKLQQQQQQQQQ
jgi:hypothetical protein